MAENDWVDVDTSETPSSKVTPTKKSGVYPTMGVASSPNEQINLILNKAPRIIEEELKTRPSMVRDIINLMQDPIAQAEQRKHPIGAALKTILGGAELVQGAIADPLLEAQKGNIKFNPLMMAMLGPQAGLLNKDVLSSLGKTLTGQRPSTLSDVYRASGVPGISTKAFSYPADLLLSATKGSPLAAYGEATMGPATQVAKTMGVMAAKMGAPAVKTAMRFMAGIPESHTQFAMDNTELLQKANLNAFGKTASKAMEDIVVPLEDNPKVKVDLTPTHEKLKVLRMTTGAGDLTAQSAKLSEKEQTFVRDTLNELNLYTGNNKPTFSRIRYLLGKLDDVLSPTYKERMKGTPYPVTDAFQNVVGRIRGAVRSSINDTNFPEANKALTQYAKWETAKNVYKTFTGMNPSFFKSLPIRLLAVAALGVKSPVAGVAALPLTMPLTYKGIMGGVNIGQKVLSEPTIQLEYMKSQADKARNQEQGGSEEDWVDVQ